VDERLHGKVESPERHHTCGPPYSESLVHEIEVETAQPFERVDNASTGAGKEHGSPLLGVEDRSSGLCVDVLVDVGWWINRSGRRVASQRQGCVNLTKGAPKPLALRFGVAVAELADGNHGRQDG